METQERILKDYTDLEKGAYLCAIASLATADRQASEEELAFLRELSDGAELSPQQKEAVVQAATQMTPDDLRQCLDVLKNSDLRFSLITDLIAFAHADQNYSEEEKANVEKIAQYLNISQQQFSFLDQFVKKTSEANVTPEDAKKPGFLQQLGLEEKMKKAGIDPNTFLRTVVGVAGPILLATMLRRRRGSTFGGGLGRGGLGGGIGGMLGGAGLGSLIGMLSGGRRMRSTGGLLGSLFGGRRGF